MKIRSDIVRTYQSIHTWTGITTGLLLFICFFAGALTMFQQSLQSWAEAPRVSLPALADSERDALIHQAMATSTQAAKGFTLHLHDATAPLSWSDTAPAHLLDQETLNYASLDDRGELLVEQYPVVHVADLIDELHRTAGIPGVVGHESLGVLVMGVISVLYFLALVSGFIFLLPTMARSFLALREGKGRFRWLLDTHNLVGVTSLPFHLLIALTVVVFAFHDDFYNGLSVIYGEQPMFPPASTPALPDNVQSSLHPLQTYLSRAAELMPGQQVSTLKFQDLAGQRPSLLMYLTSDEHLQISPQGNMLVLQPYTLDLIYSTWPEGDESLWGRLVNSFFALHFGSYGGEWVRWMYFLLGLGGAYLFYSGNLLWLSKRRQQKHYPQARLNHLAALTYGVSFGCMAGIAAAMLAGRWLAPLFDNLNLLYLSSYYLVFVAALLLAFFCSGEAARVPLLRLTAALYLLIPLSSVLAGIASPDQPLWPDAASMAVELCMLLFALGLAYRSLITDGFHKQQQNEQQHKQQRKQQNKQHDQEHALLHDNVV